MSDTQCSSSCAYAVGETFEQTFVYDDASIRQFATIAGDTNPIHHDAAFAATTRFGGLIASAAHYSAQFMGAAAAFLTQRGESLGLEFSFQFRKAVLIDSIMRLQWRVSATEPKPGLRGHIVTMTGTLSQGDGVVAVQAGCKGLVLPAGTMSRYGQDVSSPDRPVGQGKVGVMTE